MICETKTEATNVAKAGASKMTAQGYTLVYQQKALPVDLRTAVLVENWKTGVSYRVNLATRFCSCPFHAANSAFKVCKHLLWADSEKAGDVAEAEYQAHEAEKIARWEAEDEEKRQARPVISEEYQDACERYGMRGA